LKVLEQQQEGVKVIRPQGPLIGTDADQFQECLTKAIEEASGRIVLDVSTVPFVDSRGLEVLVDATEQLIRGGGALKLCGADATLREVLELTEVAPLFEQYEDTGSAVKSCP